MTRFPVFTIDPTNQCVWRLTESGAKSRLSLTPKAFQVLRYLADNPDRLITHDELIRAVWANSAIQPEVIKSHILAIRSALGDRAESPQYIETLRGRGYRFIGPRRTFHRAPYQAADAARERRVVGRDEPLAALSRIWSRAREGEPQFVLVTGEPGIGKSALIQHFIARATADSDASVGVGQCLQSFGGAGLPYQAVIEAFAAVCNGDQGTANLRTLISSAPTWATQMPSRLSDEQRARLKEDIRSNSRERLQMEGCEFVELAAATVPLILVLEDLHWADFATLDFLVALTRRRIAGRRLVIASFRPRDLEAAHPDLKPWLSDLLARRQATEIALTPLSELAVTDYVGASDPPAPTRALGQMLWERSGGNPLFLLAILDHLAACGTVAQNPGGWESRGQPAAIPAEVPATLGRLIEALFEQLPLDQQRVLEVACCAGMAFHAELCAAAVQLDALQFEELCESLCRNSNFISRGSLLSLPDGAVVRLYTFNHALYRDVLYERMGPIQRSRLQLHLAQRLEQIFPAAERGQIVEELAHHFAVGRDSRRAVEYLRLALKNAHRRFAYRDALGILDRASSVARGLPEGERAHTELEFLERRAAIYGATHDERALESYLQLYEKATLQEATNIRVRSLLGCAYVSSWHDLKQSLTFLDQALPLTAGQSDPIARYRARITIHVRRIWVSGWNESDARDCEEAAGLLEAEGNSLALACGLLDLSMIWLISGRYRQAHEQFLTSYRFVLDNVDSEGESDVARAVWMFHVGVPWILIFLGDFGEAATRYDEAIPAFERNGDTSSALALSVYRSILLFFARDYAGVNAICEPMAAHVLGKREFIAPESARTLPVEQRIAVIFCGLAELELGRAKAALEYFRAADRLMQHKSAHLDWYWRLPLEWGSVQALLLTGDSDQALTRARRLVELAEATMELTWQSFAWQADALVALARGASSDATASIKKALSITEGREAPLADWRAHEIAAKVYTELGDTAQAEAHTQHVTAIRTSLAATLPDRHPLRAGLESRSARP